MIVPECPPCDFKDLGILPTCLLFGAAGLMVEVAVVAALKGVEHLMAIRERRLRDLLRRRP